jgi:dihydroorotate dehydrogenase
MLSDAHYNETDGNEKPDLFWRILRKVAFSLDAELMHEMAVKSLRLLSPFFRKDLPESSIARDQSFKTERAGLLFRNPVGLAAGFDVDGECIPALQRLGFGFIELGGITEFPQAGNKRPRIFRIAEEKAIINRLNFYNKGVNHLKQQLIPLREHNRIYVPIGVNLGKSNFSAIENVPEEYLSVFKHMCDVVDYVTINVSCPNTEGLERYQTTESLGTLLDTLCNFNEKRKKSVPLLLKLGPDLTNEEAIACAETALDYHLTGLVISNTTKKHNELSTKVDFGPGGLSGEPLFERSTQLLRCVAHDYGGKLLLVGAGGIMDSGKAIAKFNAGADLLQVYTGFVYGGPRFVFDLLKSLKAWQKSFSADDRIADRKPGA